MTVKLRRKNSRYPDLTLGQGYVVLGIEADDFRILNNQGRPYLYLSRLFEIIDPREPEDWVTEYGDDGERYAYPPSLNNCGFFEDFFDDKEDAVATFWHVVNQRLTAAMVSIKVEREPSSHRGFKNGQEPVKLSTT